MLKSSKKSLCPVCESKNIEYQAKYRSKSLHFQNLSRHLCLDCGLQFAFPMPEEKILDNYNRSYHNKAHGGLNRNKIENAFFTGIAMTRINFIKENIKFNFSRKIRLLEVGPGPGAFLEKWIDHFPNTEYFVLESDKSCIPILKNLGAIILDEKQIIDASYKFDFLVISHVLEHVTDPKIFLSKFIKIMKKGAFAFIEVPCNDWEHKKIDEPHLLFFDKKPMIALLKKLRVCKINISYYGTPIKNLKSKTLTFLKRIRAFLNRKKINFYHPERNKLKDILENDLEVNAIIDFDAHIKQEIPSWWLRTIFKK